jgi:hypothetical protein
MPTIEDGKRAIRQGNLKQARLIFEAILQENPRNEEAWLCLAETLTNANDKRICYENVLKINKNNRAARDALRGLEPEENPFVKALKQATETPVEEEFFPEEIEETMVSVGTSPPVSGRTREQSAKTYAIARIKGHKETPLFLNQVYLLQAGVTERVPKGFKKKPITLPDQEIVQIDITVYADGMDIEPDFKQTLTYHHNQKTNSGVVYKIRKFFSKIPRSLSEYDKFNHFPNLLEFRLIPREVGQKQIRVEFYYEQHWLAQIKFEVELVSQVEPALA